MTEFLHVAVGAVTNPAGQVLIAQRPPDSHQGGLWEFPGGKLEPGESVLSALARELDEELGITIELESCLPLIKIRHRYDDLEVLLDVWQVTMFSGQVHGREGQPVSWVYPAELGSLSFPEANHAIIRVLQLPDEIAITGAASSLEVFTRHLENVLAHGIKLIQFRPGELDSETYSGWLEWTQRICDDKGVMLQVNSSADVFQRTRAAGLHLNSDRLMKTRSRPIPRDALFSASCHNLAELQHANHIDADFVFLSPVLKTHSHHGQSPLGWERFSELAAEVSVPVFALGGMHPEHLHIARQQGARGIAAISAYWQK